jgi:serine/threonine protein phosphatase PrpC
MYIAFKAIAQGDSHKEKNLPCQDAVLASAVPNSGVAIVADGHGSEKHFRSDAGSQTAVNTALYAITDFLKLQDKRKKTMRDAAYIDEQLRQLERYIIVRNC